MRLPQVSEMIGTGYTPRMAARHGRTRRPGSGRAGHVQPEAAWCGSASTRQPFGSRAEAAFRSALAAPSAPSAPSPPPLLPPRLRRYLQVALAGMMLRSLQMATRLRHVFDPSAGYAAGATLVQHGHTVAHARSTVPLPCIHRAR
eukprot:scaffold4451_cov60-Phaeocystis_antarctica.AAC.3